MLKQTDPIPITGRFRAASTCVACLVVANALSCGSPSEGSPPDITTVGQAGSSGDEGSSSDEGGSSDEGSSGNAGSSGDEGAAGSGGAPISTTMGVGGTSGGAGASGAAGAAGASGAGGAISSASWYPWQGSNSHHVRIVYLVPSDKSPDPSKQLALELAAKHFQIWEAQKIGANKAFTLTDPVVTTVQSSHDASWFSTYTTDPKGDATWRFFFNAKAEGYALTGAIDNDPNNVWAFYVDADAPCAQSNLGTLAGAMVTDADALNGLAGTPRTTCKGDAPADRSACLWVGLLGWGLTLAFHVDCGKDGASCAGDDIDHTGFGVYPGASMAAVEKKTLGASPFFASVSARPPPLFSCAPLM